MAADEARRCGGGRHAGLRGADVGDRAAVLARRQHGLNRLDELRDRRGDDGQIGTVEGGVEARGFVNGAALRGNGERSLIGIVPDDCVAALVRRQPDGGADQPGADDGNTHVTRLEADSLRDRHGFAHNSVQGWPHGGTPLPLDGRTPRRTGGTRDAPGRRLPRRDARVSRRDA
jgi:hypothetical protein